MPTPSSSARGVPARRPPCCSHAEDSRSCSLTRRLAVSTISTHILWPHGAEILGRWGLFSALPRRSATYLPANDVRCGSIALRGTIPDANDGMGGFCPTHGARRASRKRGGRVRADVREGFTVDELLVADDGHRHSWPREGQRSRSRSVPGSSLGADGVNRSSPEPWSRRRRRRACRGVCLLLIISGLRQDDIELQRPGTSPSVRTNERRPPSGDGELADQGLSDHPQ